MTTMDTLYSICLCIMCVSVAKCDSTGNNVHNGTVLARSIVKRFILQSANKDLQQLTGVSHDSNSSWSLWGDWSKSGSGNICIYGRTRTCSSPNMADCPGKNVELRPFNVSCKDTPQWSPWNPWICKHNATGDCTSFRERFCSSNDPNDCLGGNSYEESSCNEDRCTGPIWKAWSRWSCSYHGGVCFMKRTRTCSTGMTGDCKFGLPTEVRLCETNACQTPHFSPWSKWTCTQSGYSCFQHRHRTCSTGNEDDCIGAKHEVDVCGDECKDTTSTSSTTPTTPSTTTSTTPSTTTLTTPSTTTSTTPSTTTSTTPSTTTSTTAVSTPLTTHASDHIVFKIPTHPPTTTEQTSKLAELIIPTKKDTTLHHEDHDTANTTQPDSYNKSLNNAHVQISAWSQWYFSACSVSCGGGSRQGIRRCSSGSENDCQGSAFKIENCNTLPCPVNGGWGAWERWGKCSQSCGQGTQTRHRLCNDPQPEHGGAACVGSSEETESCTVTECPHWTDFYEAGHCSVTCGVGFLQMKRDCSTGNDADCTGSAYDEKPCEVKTCLSNDDQHDD